MLYMILEHFKGNPVPVYRRLREDIGDMNALFAKRKRPYPTHPALRRGCQFTAAEFRALCAHGVQQSMGKTGVCWDNALAESFLDTYKLELIDLASWSTRARARTATVH